MASTLAPVSGQDAMADSDDSSSSSYVSTSKAYTTASDGDYWKAGGHVCGECGRPWKWMCRLCQACRDAEIHLSRVQAIKFSKHPRDRMKIRNKTISPAEYVASKRVRASVLTRVVDEQQALQELQATIDCSEDARVARPDETEQERFAKIPSLRLMSGSELFIETLFPTTSFKDVYRCARECLGLKPNADSRSLRLTYIGNRLPRKECEWRYGEEIPCHDSLAYRRLQGVIMQAIIHK